MASNRNVNATLTSRVRARLADLKIQSPKWKRNSTSRSSENLSPALSYLAAFEVNGIPIETSKSLPATTPLVDDQTSTCPPNHETGSESDRTEDPDLDPIPLLAEPTATTLLSLPTELIQYIGSYLNEETIHGGNAFWLFRLTCTSLYAILGPPKYQISAWHLSMRMLNAIIPGNLAYCNECKKYHPRRPGDTYMFDNTIHVRCMRFLRSCGKAEYVILGRQYYVCETCYSRRYRRYCKKCKICEVCTGLKFTLEDGLVLDGRENKGEPEREFCDDCSATEEKY